MNAKEELIKHVAGKEVAFVSIVFNEYPTYDLIVIKGKLEEVLPLLDFEYDEWLWCAGTFWLYLVHRWNLGRSAANMMVLNGGKIKRVLIKTLTSSKNFNLDK